MIAIRGIHSSIAQCLMNIIDDTVVEIERDKYPEWKPNRYFICQGLLNGKRRIEQTAEEISDTYQVNYITVACMCDSILAYNNRARICVVGSESGLSSSYDECYADAKRLLHYYVETKHILDTQQLVCVAPSIIEDAGMTLRRTDIDNLSHIRNNHPKRRFLSSLEVARMVKFLLYDDFGYTTNVVIRMNGGKHVL